MRLLFINTFFACFVLVIVNFIDFYSKSIVYRLDLSKFRNKESLHIKMEMRH